MSVNDDYDPLGAMPQPNQAWVPAEYLEYPSTVLADTSCWCAEELAHKESSEVLLSDMIFSGLPEFMDMALTRNFVNALTPCERVSLYSDVVRWQDELNNVDAEMFAALQELVETEAVERMIAAQRQGEQAFQEEFNQVLGEIWRNDVMQSGPGYEVVWPESNE